MPSGGSAATFGLLRLARMTGEHRYEQAARSLIELLNAVVPEHPLAFGHLLRSIDFALAPVREVALVGTTYGAGAGRRGGFFPTSCWPAAPRTRCRCSRAARGRRARRRVRLSELHLRSSRHARRGARETARLTAETPR